MEHGHVKAVRPYYKPDGRFEPEVVRYKSSPILVIVQSSAWVHLVPQFSRKLQFDKDALDLSVILVTCPWPHTYVWGPTSSKRYADICLVKFLKAKDVCVWAWRRRKTNLNQYCIKWTYELRNLAPRRYWIKAFHDFKDLKPRIFRSYSGCGFCTIRNGYAWLNQ